MLALTPLTNTHNQSCHINQVAVQGVRNVGPEAEEVESAVGADEPVPELRFLVEVSGCFI